MAARHPFIAVPLLVAASMAASTCSTRGQVPYHITDLGVLPGYYNQSTATGINASGEVVGSCWYSGSGPQGLSTAFKWTPASGMRFLDRTYGISAASGINNAGQVTGWVDASVIIGVVTQHAVRWDSAGNITDLQITGGLNIDDTISFGQAINAKGQVGGSEDYGGGVAVYWPTDTSPELIDSSFNYFSSISGLNDAGVAVGTGGGGFTYSDAKGLVFLPGPANSAANGVNNNGEIVGSVSGSSGEDIAFWDSAGHFHDLGPGEGLAINDGGTIVGTDRSRGVAIISSPLGVVRDLNTVVDNGAGWTLVQANAISVSGSIVGYGMIGGVQHAYLLTPTQTPPPTCKILAVGMTDSHTLTITVAGRTSTIEANLKSVAVQTILNGKDLEAIRTLSGGGYQETFDFDLAKAHVPRFADNQVFTVTAIARDSNTSKTAIRPNNVIPLPIVHVHGFLTDLSSDRVPHKLFKALSADHPYVEDDGRSDNHNVLTLDNPYPTLVSFDYASTQQKIENDSFLLADFIRHQVLANTYAAKVIALAHSMGGVIARDAIWSDPERIQPMHEVIKKLILVGSPSEGLVLAPFSLDYWLLLKVALYGGVVIGDIADLFRIWPMLKPLCSALVSASQDPVIELCPTYGWWAEQPGGLRWILRPYNNAFLERLNLLGLHPNVAYYTIVATSFQSQGSLATPVFLWGSGVQWLNELLSDGSILGPGDGIVPSWSQLASHEIWPQGNGPGKISRYRQNGTLRDEGNLLHFNYFDSAQVKDDIEEIVWLE